MKQLFRSNCTRSDKGFAFSFDAMLAVILFIGLIATVKMAGFSNPNINLSKTQMVQLSHDTFQAMDSTGYILAQIDANFLDSAKQITAKAKTLLPSNLDLNLSLKQYTTTISSTCRNS